MTKNIILSCLIYLLAIILLKCVIRPQGIFIPQNTINASNGQIEAILSKLAACESSNNPKAYVHDDGGSPSKGLYQFKKLTFSLYWKQLINKDVEVYDIDNLWGDPEAQRQLATAMLEKDPNNIRHWLICGRKLGLIAER